jgi:glycine cleavage system H lipoate-binding protein
MNNKEYKVKVIKNYWLFSNDDSIKVGISEKLKKRSRKISRVRLK